MAVCVSGDWIESGEIPAADAGQHSGEVGIFFARCGFVSATSSSSSGSAHLLRRCFAGRIVFRRVPQNAFLEWLDSDVFATVGHDISCPYTSFEAATLVTPRQFLAKSAQVIERT